MRLASLVVTIGLLAAPGCFVDEPPPVDDGGSGSGSTTGSACERGSLGCPCFPNGTCNFDLSCVLGTCEVAPGTTTTAVADSSSTAVLDGSTGGSTSTGAGSSSSSGGESSTGGGPAHILFTTSVQVTGLRLAGLDGADQVCTMLGAPLGPGSWVAVLADANTSLDARVDVTGEVVNTQGELLAIDEAELLSGTLQHIPGYDESGAPVPGSDLAWTGLYDDCMGWTSDDPGVLGTVGLPTTADRWLDTEVPLPCSAAPRLYCISQ